MIVDWKPCTAYDGRPMSYGSPDDPQWWADGYELQRRTELERK